MTAPIDCGRCRSPMPGSLRFCDVCGEELPRPPPVPPRPSRQHEELRRLCGFWVEAHRGLRPMELAQLAGLALRSLRQHRAVESIRLEEVNGWILHAAQHPASLRLVAEGVASSLEPAARKELFDRVCQLAWADDSKLSIPERIVLRTVGQGLGLNDSFQRGAVMQRFGPLAVAEYILSVSRAAPLHALQHAYERARSELDRALSRSDLTRHEHYRIEEELSVLQAAFDQLAAQAR